MSSSCSCAPASVSRSASPSTERSRRAPVTAELISDLRARWCELRGLEIVVAEVARGEFEGEDPLQPQFRQGLSEARDALVTLHGQLEEDGLDIELEEPSEPELAKVRK